MAGPWNAAYVGYVTPIMNASTAQAEVPMLRTTILATVAAVFALLAVPAAAPAHEQHHRLAYANDNGLLVDNQNEDENDDDVVSVGEPVAYVQVQPGSAYRAQYVPVSDTIVTPYGYSPQSSNGYYQGYGYNPQYANNPYYAGAAYGGRDPVSAAVINAVVNAAANGGHLNAGDILQSLAGGVLNGQGQQPYPQQYPQNGVYGQQYAPVYTNGSSNQGEEHEDSNDDDGGGDD